MQLPESVSGIIQRTETHYYIQSTDWLYVIPPHIQCGLKELHLYATAKVQPTAIKGYAGEVVSLNVVYV